MLQQNAVPPAALELLKKICAIKDLGLLTLGGRLRPCFKNGVIGYQLYTGCYYDKPVII